MSKIVHRLQPDSIQRPVARFAFNESTNNLGLVFGSLTLFSKYVLSQLNMRPCDISPHLQGGNFP